MAAASSDWPENSAYSTVCASRERSQATPTSSWAPSAGAAAGALLSRTSPQTLDRLESAAAVLTVGSTAGVEPTALPDAMAAPADIGRIAVEAATIPENAYVALFADLVGPSGRRLYHAAVVLNAVIAWTRALSDTP